MSITSAIHHNIRLLEVKTIGMSAYVILPVVVLYFKDIIGLNFQQFLGAEAIFAITIVATELPSGWLSDIWKRKYVLILSVACWMLSFALLLFAQSFWMACLANIVIGISFSLSSGTKSALLYDTLLQIGKEDQYTKYYGRQSALGKYTAALCFFASGFLYEISPYAPIIVTLVLAVPALIATCLLIEPKRVKQPMHRNPFADIAITILGTFRQNTTVAAIVIFAATIYAVTRNEELLSQLYFGVVGLPEYGFGLLFGLKSVLSGIASQLSHKISWHNITLLVTGWAGLLVTYLFSGFFISYYGIILLMVAGINFSLVVPRVSDAINKRVGSERRATVLSTLTFLREIGFVPLSLCIGWVVESYSVSAGLYVMAVWLGLAGICLLIWGMRRGTTADTIVEKQTKTT